MATQDGKETFQLTTSKGIITALLVLLAGGGVGASAVGLSYGRDQTSQPTPWLSRAETQGLADKAEAEAVAAASVECDAKMAKLEARLQKIEETVNKIGVDVATISATLPYLARGNFSTEPAKSKRITP